MMTSRRPASISISISGTDGGGLSRRRINSDDDDDDDDDDNSHSAAVSLRAARSSHQYQQRPAVSSVPTVHSDVPTRTRHTHTAGDESEDQDTHHDMKHDSELTYV